MDAHALHCRGWTISAIARHLGHDRKTIRAYLSGGRVAGQRRRDEPDPFEPFAGYCRERLVEDPHLWASTLFDELLKKLGYDRSYPTFTRQLRARSLRPACEPCRPAKDRPVAVIEHPPGEECQFDWLELPNPPAQWGWGSGVPVGRRFGALRAVARGAGRVHRPAAPDRRLAPGVRRAGWADPHLAVRPDGHRLPPRHRPDHLLVRRGGPPLRGVGGDLPGPPRQPQGRGEKANHTAAQRWWRTLADECSPEQAQTSLDRWCLLRGDTRLRPTSDGRATVATVAAREPLVLVPAPFPAVLSVERTASAQALVAFCGNRYSVPPELARAQITVSHGSAPPTSTWPPAAGSSSPATPWPRPGPAPPSATPGTSRPWSARRWPRSPTPRRTGASSASHPARPPGPPLKPCAPPPLQAHRPHQTPQPTPKPTPPARS